MSKDLQAPQEIDLQRITDGLWQDLQGQFDRSDIRRRVERVVAHYKDAPVQAFVPVIARRLIGEELRHELRSGDLEGAQASES